MRLFVEGIGLAGPGLDGWDAARAILRAEAPYCRAATRVVPSDLLPAAERRRVGVPVKLALAAGREAFLSAGRDAAAVPTVLASSGGDCDNVHHLCESLATAEREVSPTRFHNSVHNAAAGYWGIATRSSAASTSLCGHDASFAAGLLESAAQAAAGAPAVALIAYDHPYPEPLNAVRPLDAPFGVGMVAASERTDRALAALEIAYGPERAAETRMAEPALESVRRGIPAARSLPLLAALARGLRETIALDYLGGHLRVEVTPCA